jgi:hypothetical protein
MYDLFITMQSKKIALLLLLVAAIIVKALNIDPIINIIALFSSCFVISYECFNKVEESIKYAVFLVIIFELLKVLLSVNRYTFAEHLENENLKKAQNNKEANDENDTEVQENDVNKDKNEEREKSNVNKETDDTNNFKDELKELEEHLIGLNGKDEKHNKKVPIDDMSPAQAQRELYRLVDTTNLLKKTMTEMAPVINEGKKIMKTMESLNMIN